jgi:hypothetical protein
MNEHCNVSDSRKHVSDDSFYVEVRLLCVAQLNSCAAPQLNNLSLCCGLPVFCVTIGMLCGTMARAICFWL